MTPKCPSASLEGRAAQQRGLLQRVACTSLAWPAFLQQQQQVLVGARLLGSQVQQLLAQHHLAQPSRCLLGCRGSSSSRHQAR